MTKPIITIHNVSTGEILKREMTEAEIAQRIKDEAEAFANQQQQAASAEAKAALLDKLGITADEAKLLLS